MSLAVATRGDVINRLVATIYARYYNSSLTRLIGKGHAEARANALYRLSVILSAPILAVAFGIGLAVKSMWRAFPMGIGLGVACAGVALAVWIGVHWILAKKTSGSSAGSIDISEGRALARPILALELLCYACIALNAVLLYYLGGQ